VAFAEIEKFLDTAVKHYSSGMYVRLAFAVAAHLEPEILIIDEIWQSATPNFKRNVSGKWMRLAKDGRTIIFVSHQWELLLSFAKRLFFWKKEYSHARLAPFA